MSGFQGVFPPMETLQLGGTAVKRALTQAGVSTVDEVLMGCVIPAGQGQGHAPARQAGFAAGLGDAVPATTPNKMCGSGMKAAMMAYDALATGCADIIAAGGMESMCRVSYLLPQMRGGARIIVTLLNGLEGRGLERGIAVICIGGGEGTAISLERV
jgi:acetyl-CoA C-acetyltransferase